MKKLKHAGAEARRESERLSALGVAADPKKATGAELVRTIAVEREAVVEEITRARAAPAAEREQAVKPVRVRVDRIQALEAELATRPALVKSPDGKPSNLLGRPAESEGSRLKRVLDDLAVKAGVARRSSTGVTTLSKEEEMQAHLARLRRARGPEPKAMSVAAAVAHWLTGEGWPWVAGATQELAALEDRDIAALFIALGLIARDGENGSVTVLARSPLRGTRAQCPGFMASVEHLTRNGLLTLDRRLPDVTIGYGPLTLDVARRAGLAVSGDAAR